MTTLAASMLEPVPANRLFGVAVHRASEEGGEVGLEVVPEATNVIGTLHASGLVALLDAAGLAAVIGAARDPDDLEGVSALGASAGVDFVAPARGRLTARSALTAGATAALQELYDRHTDRTALRTTAAVADESGTEVCRGHFDWRIRRLDVARSGPGAGRGGTT